MDVKGVPSFLKVQLKHLNLMILMILKKFKNKNIGVIMEVERNEKPKYKFLKR